MKNVIILTRAANDLEEARQFYEAQQPGLGEHGVDSVLTSVARLGGISGVHARAHRYQRMIEKAFHLGIYYREHGDETLVVAILDLRRDPRWIRQQLRTRPNT